MNVTSFLFRNEQLEKQNISNHDVEKDCQLLLGFGNKTLITNPDNFQLLRNHFPKAEIVLCSTAGEICGSETHENTIVLTAIAFETTKFFAVKINASDFQNSFEAGAGLVKKLDLIGLQHIFILSDGGMVNGSELVRGVESVVDHKIPVTGGLAGDGTNFQSTAVGLNSLPAKGNIVGIGFYGEHIKIGYGSKGGWEMFGLEKTVTKSESNIVYEIDNKNALELYKNYLGKFAEDLPGSALLFPLSVQLHNSTESVVRTILSIDITNNSMVFAGDVPQGSKVRFMRSNFDNLIEAASLAAQNCQPISRPEPPKLALLISCVGRKIILNKRVDEEVEAVANVLGSKTISTGFYSYGEITPLQANGCCQLHNQTMTITTFDED